MDEQQTSVSSAARSRTANHPEPREDLNSAGVSEVYRPDRQRRERVLAGASCVRESARIAVVIVNHNDRDHLRACLASIPPLTETVVVDNASTDGSLELVRAEYPRTVLLADGTNPGYGAAVNKGIHFCRTEYVVVLNSDTVLAPDAPATLSRYLDEHPRAALIGPRILNPDGTPQPSVFPFPGTLRWLLENDPVAPVLGSFPPVRRTFYRFAPPTEAMPVPWVLGAAMAIRRDAFIQVGGFDESYFLYFEEVDLCRRLRSAGWEIHFVPDTFAMHAGGATTSHTRAIMAVEHFRSTLHFYRRHYRGARLAAWILIMRTKMLFRLIRDSLALATTVEHRARARLREDLGGWRKALKQTGR